MSASRFKFVSPGIFLKEIDNSQLPGPALDRGPMVVGLFERGPGMVPTRIESLSDFVETFGNPIPGGKSGDVWRDGNYMAPTYAAYAAQAWLANNGPVNILRILGAQNSSATTAGQAGWQTTNDLGTDPSSAGGAYGLWVVESGSVTTNVDMALAAVFYLDAGEIALSGNMRALADLTDKETLAITASNSVLIESTADTGAEFRAVIKNASGVIQDQAVFNFDPQSDKYIRKVFNTNPTLVNSTITESGVVKSYWLGETFERHMNDTITTSAKCFGVITGLGSGSADWSNRRFGHQAARTGWVISQDLGDRNNFVAEAMPKLFKFHSRNTGEWDQKNLKVTIEDIKRSGNLADKYGTFTVTIRGIADIDKKPQVIERFSNCNLNPNSPNFIGRKIGDKYYAFSESQRRSIEYGEFDNRSRFLRLEIAKALRDGSLDPELLPFGFFGPPKPANFTYTPGVTGGTGLFYPAGAITGAIDSSALAALANNNAFIKVGDNTTNNPAMLAASSSVLIKTQFEEIQDTAAAFFTGTFKWPTMALRSANTDDGTNLDQVRFGIDMRRSSTSKLWDASQVDIARALPETLTSNQFADDLTDVLELEHSFVFSLDDVSGSNNNLDATYTSGSRRTGTSLSVAANNGYTGYNAIIEYGVKGFTMPLFGGHDGLDITEKNPLRNAKISDSATETTDHVYNSLRRAIDIVRDPEDAEYDLVTIPGVNKPLVTNLLLEMVEDRADALAIIDVENDYTPASESTDGYQSRVGDADNAARTMRDRELDTSYGCAYFPWVQIQDTVANQLVWVPPSVVALGAMSFGQAKQKLWFAPAGFNRGGLSTGAAGMPVTGITQKLTSKQRDTLYAANINPIASFPSEGIVIFGQKTLQASASALDRINVRRLLLFIKKRVSAIAATILFDNNVQVTWNRFLSQVDPFLKSVKLNLGLTDYKIVLDETTTTPDLVDRNILYAKIFLKPARAIEFIAIDFNIARTGAAFAD